MLQKPLFKEFFALLVVIGVLNYLANLYDWFWVYASFDALMHFLAGIWVALFFLWFYFYSGFFAPQKRNLWHFLVMAILELVLVATMWDAYELVLGEAQFHKVGYAWDTISDLIMGMLGGLTACLYGYFKELKSYVS